MDDYASDQQKMIERIHQLGEAALRGNIDPDSASQLEDLVVHNAEARDVYASFILDTTILRAMASRNEDHPEQLDRTRTASLPPAAPAAKVGSSHSVCDSHPVQKRSPAIIDIARLFAVSSSSVSALRLLLLAIGAAGFSAGLMFGMRADNKIGPDERHLSQKEPGNLSPSVTPAAYLTSTNGCSWAYSSPEIRSLGSSVHPGDEIALHEGIAEFRLASGVALSVEGPAAMVMTSPSSLVLQHGKVTVYVPWTVTDFRLTASACRFTACDAEFGINVAGGVIDLHTFSGRVFATPAIESRCEDGFGIDVSETSEVIEREEDLPQGTDFSKTNVVAGRGLTLQSKGNVTKVAKWHTAEKDEFATKLTMAGPLPITDSYQEAVLASKPISYWRFEECKNYVVTNEISDACALMINGDLRLAGDSSNRVAEFGRPGSKCFLQSDGALKLHEGSQYSVELWVKPSHVHEGSLVCMLADLSPDRKERAAFYLQTIGFDHSRIDHPRQSVRFLHRDPPGFMSQEGTSCYSQMRYSVRRWQYMVATKSDSEIRLYIDGVLAAKRPETSSLAANLHLEVGQCGIARPVNPFIGQLDELAIYSRVLSEAEILKHFKAVEFKSPPAPSRQDI